MASSAGFDLLRVAERVGALPGVVAVTLGGSRASGAARPGSDWDLGVYYRDTIDPDDVRALGWPGQVSAPGEWGRLVDGGAWLTIDGERVDLIYRCVDTVEHWTREAEAGRFEVWREVGYVAGIPTYLLAGELALCRVLVGELPRRPLADYPAALRASAPPLWRRIAAGAVSTGELHARRGDRIAALANLSQAVLAAAHAILAERGEWTLNEKRMVARAGLDHVAALFVDGPPPAAVLRNALLLPAWP